MPGTRSSNRQPSVRLAVLVAAALAVGLAVAPAGASVPAGTSDASGSADASADGRLRALLAKMSLREKVGQLFMTYAYGQSADTTAAADRAENRKLYGVDTPAEVVEKYKLGGIVYFAWSNNVADPKQIAGLSNGLQRTAAGQRTRIPLLISTDQEQGVVVRVGPPATQFPGSMALGAGRDAGDARKAARITGEEIRALGINQNYAPDADVNVNPANPVIGVRSFSSDADLVSRMVTAQVNGYERDVAATAKHFPGHGDTNVDSHFGLPVIDHSRDELDRIDLPPFRAAIREGVDSIMTAHIVVPALDASEDPATLSKPILTGLLRQELGYDGVVTTDSLQMQGVREKYGDDRVPVLALKAGVDQLLMPADMDVAYNAVLDAVRSGEISERRIDQSVLRVLRLKHERGLFSHRYVDVDKVDEVVGTPDHLAAAQRVADKTVTLVKDDADVLPLSTDTGSSDSSVLVTGWGASTTQTLADRIAARGPTASVYETGVSPTQAQIDAAVTQAKRSDLAVVTTMKAWDSNTNGAGQQQLVDALVGSGTPVVVLAVRDPYDIAYFTDAPTYLATYSYSAVSLEAATRVLFGERAPAGKLPVSIPVADDPDKVLYPFGHGLTGR